MPSAAINHTIPTEMTALDTLSSALGTTIDISARFEEDPGRCVGNKVRPRGQRCARPLSKKTRRQAIHTLNELADLDPENSPELCVQRAEQLLQHCLCTYHRDPVREVIEEWRQEMASSVEESEAESAVEAPRPAASRSTIHFSQLDEPSPAPERVPASHRTGAANATARRNRAPSPVLVPRSTHTASNFDAELQAIIDRANTGAEDDETYEPSEDEDEQNSYAGIHTPPAESDEEIFVTQEDLEDEVEEDEPDTQNSNRTLPSPSPSPSRSSTVTLRAAPRTTARHISVRPRAAGPNPAPAPTAPMRAQAPPSSRRARNAAVVAASAPSSRSTHETVDAIDIANLRRLADIVDDLGTALDKARRALQEEARRISASRTRNGGRRA